MPQARSYSTPSPSPIVKATYTHPSNLLPGGDGRTTSPAGNFVLKLGRDVPIGQLSRYGPMPDKNAAPRKAKKKPFCPQQVLQWAMWHPGVLVLSALAVRTMMGTRNELSHSTIADLHETDDDFLDSEIPLFL
jgi:hypothetical protein